MFTSMSVPSDLQVKQRALRNTRLQQTRSQSKEVAKKLVQATRIAKEKIAADISKGKELPRRPARRSLTEIRRLEGCGDGAGAFGKISFISGSQQDQEWLVKKFLVSKQQPPKFASPTLQAMVRSNLTNKKDVLISDYEQVKRHRGNSVPALIIHYSSMEIWKPRPRPKTNKTKSKTRTGSKKSVSSVPCALVVPAPSPNTLAVGQTAANDLVDRSPAPASASFEDSATAKTEGESVVKHGQIKLLQQYIANLKKAPESTARLAQQSLGKLSRKQAHVPKVLEHLALELMSSIKTRETTLKPRPMKALAAGGVYTKITSKARDNTNAGQLVKQASSKSKASRKRSGLPKSQESSGQPRPHEETVTVLEAHVSVHQKSFQPVMASKVYSPELVLYNDSTQVDIPTVSKDSETQTRSVAAAPSAASGDTESCISSPRCYPPPCSPVLPLQTQPHEVSPIDDSLREFSTLSATIRRRRQLCECRTTSGSQDSDATNRLFSEQVQSVQNVLDRMKRIADEETVHRLPTLLSNINFSGELQSYIYETEI